MVTVRGYKRDGRYPRRVSVNVTEAVGARLDAAATRYWNSTRYTGEGRARTRVAFDARCTAAARRHPGRHPDGRISAKRSAESVSRLVGRLIGEIDARNYPTRPSTRPRGGREAHGELTCEGPLGYSACPRPDIREKRHASTAGGESQGASEAGSLPITSGARGVAGGPGPPRIPHKRKAPPIEGC